VFSGSYPGKPIVKKALLPEWQDKLARDLKEVKT